MNDDEQLPAIVPSNVLSRTERLQKALKEMLERGARGMCSIEEVAEWSGYAPESQNISFFVSKLRELLCQYGFYLTGEGQEGQGFFIVSATENAVVASHKRNAATRQLVLMETLLVKTDRTGMTPAEIRRHEKELRKLKYINRMVDRREDVIEVVKKHKPSILKDDIEI